jgi:hypothetical protein
MTKTDSTPFVVFGSVPDLNQYLIQFNGNAEFGGEMSHTSGL